MSRIRSVKPAFWEDEGNGRLSIPARLLFIATFNMADDEGRLRWTAPYLRASAFMYDDGIDVAALMTELEAGPIRAYEAGGERLAVIVNFRKHQVIPKATDSKLRPPPEIGEDPLSEDYGSPTVVLQEDYHKDRKGLDRTESIPVNPSDESPASGKTPRSAVKSWPAPVTSAGTNGSGPSCPVEGCDRKQVDRSNPEDDHAFLGCTRYPDCRWTKTGRLGDRPEPLDDGPDGFEPMDFSELNAKVEALRAEGRIK